MCARRAEDGHQQVGSAIGHLAVLGEILRALDVDGDAQDLAQLIQAAELALQQGQRAQHADAGRTPGLGQLPILNWLFKRDQVRDESTELLIFITPRIIKG